MTTWVHYMEAPKKHIESTPVPEILVHVHLSVFFEANKGSRHRPPSLWVHLVVRRCRQYRQQREVPFPYHPLRRISMHADELTKFPIASIFVSLPCWIHQTLHPKHFEFGTNVTYARRHQNDFWNDRSFISQYILRSVGVLVFLYIQPYSTFTLSKRFPYLRIWAWFSHLLTHSQYWRETCILKMFHALMWRCRMQLDWRSTPHVARRFYTHFPHDWLHLSKCRLNRMNSCKMNFSMRLACHAEQAYRDALSKYL